MPDGELVGVLDSGLGGLSVLREIRRQLPAQNLIYLADQAHIPYGPRPLTQIRSFTVAITQFLLDQGARMIVVACNTASAAALYHLRATFPEVPFVGMEPAVKPAAAQSRNGVVGVIATPATFQGELFASLVDRYARKVVVLEQVCPGLVEQVEAGALQTPETVAMLHTYLDPLLAEKMDTLVLGCTHYPFLAATIRQVVGSRVKLIDPGPAVARQTGRVLTRNGWLAGGTRPGRLTSFTSGETVVFRELATRLLADAGQVRGVRWEQEKRIVLA